MMVAKEPTKIEKLQTQIKEVSSLLQKSTNVKTDLSKSLTLLESQIGSRKELMEELTIEKIKSEKNLEFLSKKYSENVIKFNLQKEKYYKLLRLKWKDKQRKKAILEFFQLGSLSSKIKYYIVKSQYEKQKKIQLKQFTILLKEYFDQAKELKSENKKIQALETKSILENEKIIEDVNSKKKLLQISSSEVEKLKLELKKLESEKLKLAGMITKDIEVASKQISSSRITNKYGWKFPLQGGVIISKFGKNILSDHLVTKNNGIDIQSSNAFVTATNEGEVVQIRQLPNQSYMILLRHGDYYSLYSNLESVLIKTDENIQKGTNLGKCLATQNGQYELHFEIWQSKTPLNPVEFIR